MDQNGVLCHDGIASTRMKIDFLKKSIEETEKRIEDAKMQRYNNLDYSQKTDLGDWDYMFYKVRRNIE